MNLIFKELNHLPQKPKAFTMSSEPVQALLPSQSDDVPQSQTSSNTNVSSFEDMRACVNKSVSRLTSKTKIFSVMKEHIRPWYEHDKEYVVEIYKSMMDQLDTMIKEEIDMMFDSSYLHQLLSELDQLKQDCNNTSETWRPSGNPEKDLVAHLQESSEKELENLEKVYAALLSKNKWLNECMEKTSTKVNSDMKALDNALQGWSEAASVVTSEVQEEIINVTHKFSAVNFLEEES